MSYIFSYALFVPLCSMRMQTHLWSSTWNTMWDRHATLRRERSLSLEQRNAPTKQACVCIDEFPL